MPKSFYNAAQKHLAAQSPKSVKVILRGLCEQISSEDTWRFEPDFLADIAARHYDMAGTRKPGQPRIKIYCPVSTADNMRKTVIDIVSDDMAFLIDSVAAEINRHDLLIDHLLHPVVHARYRDNDKKLAAVLDKGDEGTLRQSHIHIHIRQALTQKQIQALESGLRKVLQDVYISNRDWKAMLSRLEEARHDLAAARTNRPPEEIDQYCAFLDYLYDNNFTLLGYREYEFVESAQDGLTSKIKTRRNLGLLDKNSRPAFINESKESLPRNLQELRIALPPVSISKTNRMSTVHRPVPMDAIAVKTYDHKGRITGERLFLGLFTSVTYSRSVTDVPYLREKVARVLEISKYETSSHNYKSLKHILEKYPRDELFQITPEELLQICKDILELQERQRIALFMRKDPFKRYISCLVYVPRDRFGTDLRKTFAGILEEELKGELANFYTTLDDSLFARVMFIIRVNRKNMPKVRQAQIESRLQEAGQTWQERLSAAITQEYEDENRITAHILKYGQAFPLAYTVRYEEKTAVFDIAKFEEALGEDRLSLDLYRPECMGLNNLRLKVYNPDTPLNLSDVMPILGNMGLKAISELPFEIKPKSEDGEKAGVLWMHDFRLETPDTEDFILIRDVKESFEEAFLKIWYGEMEDDPLNCLILSAKMNWQEVTILRAYVRYMRQIRYPLSRGFVENALIQNPKISRMIVDLFKAFLNPEHGDNAESFAAGCAIGIDHELEKVESLDQDKALRSITALVEATLRSNFYQLDEEGRPKPYLSLKFKSETIRDLPKPRPYREIFVYSPRVEGVHLRADKIARGGIRWSDRHEDFRTEVLGLMKAQMVKNAVIVPMGAKGGFVMKSDIRDRGERQKEGIACYQIFIKGLLDITDNRKGNKIIAPDNVVCRDEEDPYLVVAADKGTASFSDIANELSLDYGFWLGDAFASGGSAGYDHKEMGITARGAWESVRLHFRQLNHNTQTQPFDVVGVGDMGGDVFGNGMLLSEQIRLIGAFNHLHIFCDPDPDPNSSFEERKRLFDEVKGWDEYDKRKLSKGGEIFSRSDKLLTLTPEIKERFDIQQDKCTPLELIRAMLKSRTDLLWFGGIGTYIKSSRESHADVGDKANDPVRVNADELRAKVIGEGANLALTQLGRIQFAEQGGRINTDFVDNSGGVDSSDHEVNIKILLSEVVRRSKYKLDTRKRNKLLKTMTDDVAAHVLRNNYQQAQAVSLTEMKAPEDVQVHADFIQDLEREHGLDRKIEGLPDEETIENRQRAGKGLTRPEICVLLSHAKINFTKQLLACDLLDNKNMQSWVMDYFPEVLQDKYPDEVRRHRLSREITAMSLANSIINRLGPTFLNTKMKKTGASCSEVTKAYIIVRDAFELPALWASIEAMDNKVPAEVQLKAMGEIRKLFEYSVAWFLARFGAQLNMSKDVAQYHDGIMELRQTLDKFVTPGVKEQIDQRRQVYQRDGLPEDLARQIALMPVLSSACDIIRIAIEDKAAIEAAARIYFEIGDIFHLDWLRQQARYLPTDSQWQSEAIEGLITQLYSCQAGLSMKILKDCGVDKKQADEVSAAVRDWLASHPDQGKLIEPIFKELRTSGAVDLSMLVIAEQRLRQLYGG